MFVAGDKYSRKVIELFASEEPLDVAIAFWGKGAQAKALSKSNAKRRIICNLGSGGTNPEVIEVLCKSVGVKVQKLDNLHAKVVIGKSIAIVGSANFSANGLGLEDGELAHWEEAGYVVTDPKEIEALRSWFTDMWEKRASDISPADLEKSENAWNIRRVARPKPAMERDGFIITDSNWREFKDRGIHVLVWGYYPTKEDRNEENGDRTSRQNAIVAETGVTRVRLPYDYYHTWIDEIDSVRDGFFIDVHWMSRSDRFECRGARRAIEGGHLTGRHGTIDILERISHLGKWPFASEEKKAFSSLMNSLPKAWRVAQEKKCGRSFVVSLNELLEARFCPPPAPLKKGRGSKLT